MSFPGTLLTVATWHLRTPACPGLSLAAASAKGLVIVLLCPCRKVSLRTRICVCYRTGPGPPSGKKEKPQSKLVSSLTCGRGITDTYTLSTWAPWEVRKLSLCERSGSFGFNQLV